MERYRLKNIILLILALTNLFLLASLLTRQAQESNMRQKAKEQMTTLFHSEKYRLELLLDRIPEETPSAALNLTRDSKQERRLAVFFLGKELHVSPEGGGIVRYENEKGAAVFRSGGDFEVTLSDALPLEDPDSYCMRFFRKFSYKEPASTLRDGTGTITAIQYFDKHPILNCAVTFTFSHGVLQTVSGRYLPGSFTSAAPRDCISAFTALTSFLQYFSENGVVCKAVTALDLSYELQSLPGAPLFLTPVWRLTTDAAQQFYINATTGQVSQTRT